MTLVLASGSPQRRAILEALGVAFEVRPVDVIEGDEGPAVAVARENALRKALAGRGAESETVLGVDTVVALELELWGKPPDAEGAAETLRRLSGRTHEVVSGFALIDAAGVRAGHDVTQVTFRELDDRAIDWYVASGEWEGRAGGYAIQGRGGALVRRIEGDYLNVVGLPVAALLDAGLPGLGS
ncbi:MAG: maf [Solirubrobacteraceae bacterium]|nr:maf [Solirubrobacteraceae bacterium]